MKNKRRNHSGSFKVKVALAAAKGDKTIAELASEFGVHPTQVTQWKKQLLERASDVFAGKKKADMGVEQEVLHTKIGQLTMENDFLSKALGRINGPSAKR